MKANCRALKFSIIISSMFLILTIIFTVLILRYENKLLEILLNIFIGLFGSGCVALLLAIPAYMVSKRQLLEKYYQEASRLIGFFSNLDFLFNEYDDKIVISYVNELKNKKWRDEYNKISRDKIVEYDKKYKNMLIKEYMHNNKHLEKKISRQAFICYADEKVDKHIERIRVKAKKIYHQYIIISKESTVELNLMLGDMQFFSGKKQFIKIYNNIYKPLYDILNVIQEESYHFKFFLDGDGNEVNALEKLLMLQKNIFDVETEESQEYKKYIIRNKFLDKMLVNLERFRADIYGIEPDYVVLNPVECRTRSKIT